MLSVRTSKESNGWICTTKKKRRKMTKNLVIGQLSTVGSADQHLGATRTNPHGRLEY